MKKLSLFAVVFALLGAAPVDPDTGLPNSTERKVHGVITAIEPSKMTIASAQHAVTGKIDEKRTKVTVHGQPGKIGDLQLTAHAKGELCLDDVWLVIDTH